LVPCCAVAKCRISSESPHAVPGLFLPAEWDAGPAESYLLGGEGGVKEGGKLKSLGKKPVARSFL